jgi:hypothetical protein
MAAKDFLLLIAAAIVFLTIKGFFLKGYWSAVILIGIWGIATYVTIRKKNKDIRTPRPVYSVD